MKKKPTLYSGGHGLMIGLLVFTGIVYYMRQAAAAGVSIK
jgi:hypothetical protein